MFQDPLHLMNFTDNSNLYMLFVQKFLSKESNNIFKIKRFF